MFSPKLPHRLYNSAINKKRLKRLKPDYEKKRSKNDETRKSDENSQLQKYKNGRGRAVFCPSPSVTRQSVIAYIHPMAVLNGDQIRQLYRAISLQEEKFDSNTYTETSGQHYKVGQHLRRGLVQEWTVKADIMMMNLISGLFGFCTQRVERDPITKTLLSV